MNAVRLLVADADGTLVTREKVLTARVNDAVYTMRAAGKVCRRTGEPLYVRCLARGENHPSRKKVDVQVRNRREQAVRRQPAKVL
jgi:hypothetical protein